MNILQALKDNNQDFEWYPTTQKMIDVVKTHLKSDFESIMDIGAGDGRVLVELAKKSDSNPSLYAIEQSPILIQTWEENIIPVGTNFFEQNLTCLQVDYVFCNPPYSEYELWTTSIIENAFAEKAFLIIPQRWKNSPKIAESIKKRNATVRVIHSDDFLDAERSARAVVDILEINFLKDKYDRKPEDPFDVWFSQNVDTFDKEEELDEESIISGISKKHDLNTINGLVDSFNEEYLRMQDNYKAIFKIDFQILSELGVNKHSVCQGLKKRIEGLKTKYWTMFFERLTPITSRLCVDTKKKFLAKLTGRAGIAFTVSNAYSVVLWSIKNANKYFDEQLVNVFKKLSTKEGIQNYKSNQKTWSNDGWRYLSEEHCHYSLDYRIVIEGYTAICGKDSYGWEYTNGLHNNCHDKLGDILAVLNNLGYNHSSVESRNREWKANNWQDFCNSNGETILQAKAFLNGNIHLRFMPEAIRALNVEAGRLLGWLKNTSDVVNELGYTVEEADKYFHSSRKILPSSMKLLGFS